MTSQLLDGHPIAAARGDDSALAELVQRYHARVYRFGLRVCRNQHDAEDAVQEAFYKLVQRPDVIEHRGALSWLFSVVRYLCFLPMRPFVLLLPTHVASDREIEQAPATLDPERALERWRLVQAVHAAIAGLDPAQREVLVLRDLEGLSGFETCRVLGISLANMKTRLHRARTSLRASLEAQPAAPGGG
jgi:RNA polymerase sigma-70 factor, ECF subfamily